MPRSPEREPRAGPEQRDPSARTINNRGRVRELAPGEPIQLQLDLGRASP